MKRQLLVCCALILIPGFALGQELSGVESGRGYTFVAPGAVVSSGGNMGFLHFGGGGEVILAKGFGIGCEIGYVGPMEYMEQGVGLFSLNGLYSFKTNRLSRISPFVTGGYSVLFGSGHLNAVNFGAGIHYWFSRRVGLRLEVRDHVSPGYFSDHLIQGRIGIALR